jgi:threonine dehydratase
LNFPSGPGALLNFLSRLGGHNISLFHYRNHGAAYGRVLVGMQVGKKTKAELDASLDAVGYPWSEETGNPAYQLFLR